MQSNSTTLRPTLVAAAVALAIGSTSAFAAPSLVKGTIGGTYFTPPVISDNPATAAASSTVPSVYAGAKVCFDLNDNGVCDAGEPYTMSSVTGSFTLSTRTLAPLVAEISTSATNNGHPVVNRNVFRVKAEQISAATVNPLLAVAVDVTPLTTEIARSMEADALSFGDARDHLAQRLNVASDEVLLAPTKVQDLAAQPAIYQESVVDTGRFELAARFVDRGTASGVKDGEQQAMNLESIPRYDNIFIIILENKDSSVIYNTQYTPKITALLQNGNQFYSYYATGVPSEPNYTALGGGDDWSISDDDWWTCNSLPGGTGYNAGSNASNFVSATAIQDLPIPSATSVATGSPGCGGSDAAAHNIVGKPNLFNALSSHGMKWRVYSETMTPGQDPRIDSIGSNSIVGTDADGASLTLPNQLYRVKHHPGMAFQNVRSAPEFYTSNRTLGGGDWDAAIAAKVQASVQAGTPILWPNSSGVRNDPTSVWNVDQFSADLQSGDVGTYNFLVPDQCDDMHAVGNATDTNTPYVSGAGGNTGADCTGNAILRRSDNYVQKIVNEIEASPLWTNPYRRVAIVVMFDEGSATSGYRGCCGWNTNNNSNIGQTPLIVNADGSTSPDAAYPVPFYYKGNPGHGESVFGVITNQQPNQGNGGTAPQQQFDSDYYSHFSFVRTLQDMFGLSDPGQPASYMGRSKYTESFIAANLLNLPEYNGSADPHFDSVRPMNHAYVFPAGAVRKQAPSAAAAYLVTGPDPTQTNLWALK